MSQNTKSQAVESPCVSLCNLDETDICEGCFRHIDEISGWTNMSNDEKHRVKMLAAARAESS